MIKAYWPVFEEKITELKEKGLLHLPDAEFVNLIIRAAITTAKDEKIHPPINVREIRQIAKNTNNEYQKKDALENIFSEDKIILCCRLIDYWLLYSNNHDFGLPPFIRSEIAKQSGEVYLLLFWLAKRELETTSYNLDTAKYKTQECCKYILGLATSIHWFSLNKSQTEKNKRINLVFKKLKDNSMKKSDFNGIFSPEDDANPVCMSPDKLNIDFIGDDIDAWIDKEGRSEAWNQAVSQLWNDDIKRAHFISICRRDKSQRIVSLLSYAQRKYMSNQFTGYDPSNISFWENYNRPWDYDHILPASTLYNRRNKRYMLICREFVNHIGNLRAIPYEENRSDRNILAKEKIKTPEDFENSFLTQEQMKGLGAGEEILWDKNGAEKFINSSQSRLVRIYSEWWETLDIYYLFDNAKCIH